MQDLKRYFKKIHNHLDASFNRALRRYGLTSTQFDFLIYLMENSVDRPTLTDLASHFGVRHTSAIHVLKILQDKGFIEKETSSDGRSKIILLTNQGMRIVTDVIEKTPLINSIIFRGFSENELHLLEKMLDRISGNLESYAFENMWKV